MLIAFAILLFLAVAAATWWFGLWSNLITLVNLILAGLTASSIYQPVANAIVEFNVSFVLLADFISMWVCFVLTFLILRSVTDFLSGYRLKFDPIVEMAGRTILSLWIAGVFVCFTMFTLQMAPIKSSHFGSGGIRPAEMGNLADKSWLAFIQSRSRGALSASKQGNFLFGEYTLTPHPDDAELDARVFDPKAKYLIDAYFHRMAIASSKTLRVRPPE